MMIYFPVPRRGGLSEINQRITDLRMGSQAPQTQIPTNNRSNQQLLSQTLLLSSNQQQEIRRDSNATTVSSYYGSMKSGASPLPFSSRRSSEVSQVKFDQITLTIFIHKHH